MLKAVHLLLFRHRNAWLLALGLLAVVVHGLAGTGSMRAGMAAAGGSFVADVCTGHRVTSDADRQLPAGNPLPASTAHDCCKLCAAGAPLLTAAAAIAVPLAPTFGAPRDRLASARPTPVALTAHPPRGPPAA